MPAASQSPRAFLDLELGRNGQLFKVGGLHGGREYRRPGRLAPRELDAFFRGARALVGHNLLRHDLPWLRERAPDLALLRLPVLDTLVLSPLVYPERPYHPLLKDDQLARDSKPDPVADCRSCATLLADIAGVLKAGRGRPSFAFVRAVLTHPQVPEASTAYADLFDEVGVPVASLSAAWGALRPQLGACERALDAVSLAPTDLLPLAYAAAWMQVPEPGSVLPAWVRHTYPRTSEILRALRDVDCGACAWCRDIHDPRVQLQRYFKFDDFRPTPRDADGGSLQAHITATAMRDEPLFAVLPTGGGKSVCFQLPGIVRHARRGLLTVVLSPLQSLMMDQVHGLEGRSDQATAIHGSLNLLERRKQLEKVRSGEVDILYLSPEQLRNPSVRRVLHSREIGAWVFDEAHCLSKWGHDFRTDYLYAPRFIRELSEAHGVPPAPVQCFTATSQNAVTKEILAILHKELGQTLQVFDGGTERDNLRFHVESVSEPRKPARIEELLIEHLPPDAEGSAVVFAASRKRTESLAKYLTERGFLAEAYHAGLEANERREVQERFIHGALRVVCATSAFGMGVDKDDVRLVVHHDVPGSLESYLQQAGRAGRDRKPSDCYLLFEPGDVEQQFRLASRSELRLGDLRALWRGIQRVSARTERGARGAVEVRQVSQGELIRMDELHDHFDAQDRMAQTRVNTGVSWLERAGLLQRDENAPRVFQGRPKVADLAEAERRMEELVLPESKRRRYRSVLTRLLSARPDEGLDAAELAELAVETAPEDADPIEAGRQLFKLLHNMAEAGLITPGIELTALIRHKVKDPGRKRLARLLEVEAALLELLPEQVPDALDAGWVEVDLLRLAADERLQDTSTDELRRLLGGLQTHGLGFSRERASADVIGRGMRLRARLRRPWREVLSLARQRAEACRAVWSALPIPTGAEVSSALLVPFTLERMADAIHDARLSMPDLHEPLAAAENALLHLHDHRVLTLQGGLAIFRQAMTLRRRRGDRKRSMTPADIAPLEQFYGQRRVQIHVMAEYARLGVEDTDRALRLAADWFAVDTETFVQTWFQGSERVLELATTAASHRRIVEDLRDPVQQRIVTAPVEQNQLVLAGPGSGKTRVLVHRIAWLLRVKRVRPRGILAVCYTRANAVEIRSRLRALVGDDARGVMVHTLHGIAMRLVGRFPSGGDESFDRFLDEAADILSGETTVSGLEPDAIRDALLRGYTHILVDEYQDIDARQHRLIRAIAGRGDGDERRLSIFAVGDDDQNIYAFRDADVAWLRGFAGEYDATTHSLTDCYRCSGHILSAASAFIAPLPGRMKADTPLRLDAARREAPAGGGWVSRDPVVRGRVQKVTVRDERAAASWVLREVQRLRGLGVEYADIAILAHRRDTLAPIRTALRAQDIPVRWPLSHKHAPPLARIRAVFALQQALAERIGSALDAATLRAMLDEAAPPGPESPWRSFLESALADVIEGLGERGTLPAERVRHNLWDAVVTERGERAVGQGVRLGTLHGAKGLEFRHVIVLDGGEGMRATEDEHRRLLYVGMTRARETLALVVRGDHPHPLLAGFDTPELVRARWGSHEGAPRQRYQYGVLGLGDLFLDWAGQHADRAAALERTRFDDRVELRRDGSWVWLVNADGWTLGALAKDAQETWLARPDLRLRVLALTVREASQTSEPYRGLLQTDRWLVPVCEARWRG